MWIENTINETLFNLDKFACLYKYFDEGLKEHQIKGVLANSINGKHKTLFSHKDEKEIYLAWEVMKNGLEYEKK